MTDTATTVPGREAPASRPAGAAPTLAKIILVGLVDALLILCFVQSLQAKWWLAVGFFVIVFAAVNIIYFTKRALPFKYLLPGVIFLVAFQLYTMVFTGYQSFTNYGTGHLGDKQSSISSIESSSVVPVEGGVEYSVLPVVQNGAVSMLIANPDTGQVQLGTNSGLTDVAAGDVQRNGERLTGLTGYDALNLATLSGNADYNAQWTALAPPLDADSGIYLRAISITKATQARAGYVYDEARDAMVSTSTNEVFPADGDVGFFKSDAGQVLDPGWQVNVGFANYAKLFGDAVIRSSFIPILLWTFVFAIVTTIINFALGLALALVLNDRRMRGQGIYRALLIVPYALPAVMMTLVWKGMLNTDFGLINQVLGAQIPWLNDPIMAKISIFMVNLWLGFPYFFLVCSGALTAIPADLKEAAFVDGASGRYAFRTVVLPLLLVATAPLLVTTFAFNFNNYGLIAMLTNGGPFSGSVTAGGSTDLLINFTIRTAFTPASQQIGLAAAIAMLIFVIVGTVSAFGFRLTRRLEEIGR